MLSVDNTSNAPDVYIVTPPDGYTSSPPDQVVREHEDFTFVLKPITLS